MHTGRIYKATSKTSGKSYIGETTLALEKRKQKHAERAKGGKGNEKFMRAIRKYGFADFQWSVLEEVEASTIEVLEQRLHEKECYFIDQFNSIEDGYNVLYGCRNQGGCAGKFNPAFVEIVIPREEFLLLAKQGKTRKELATYFSIPFNHVRIFLERLYHTEPELKMVLARRQYAKGKHHSEY